MKASFQNRNGTAAVEASLMMPVLLFIFLGAIDVAQYINVCQVISNASREGAMIAISNSTTSESDVQTAVFNYLYEHFPSLGDETSTLNVTVGVVDSQETDFGSAESGDPISVTVSFQFADVRWIPGPEYWTGPITSETISRKQ